MPHTTASRQRVTRERLGLLTPRECEIVGLVAQGMINAETGKRLSIQPESVKKTVARILAKLQLQDRVQLVVALRGVQLSYRYHLTWTTRFSEIVAMNPALATDGPPKCFGPRVAVDNLSLQIPQGHLFGLVSPNSAGRIIAMSMTCGLLRPDYRTARVSGDDVWADPVTIKKHVRALPDRMLLFDCLTGPELLRYNGWLRHLAPEIVEKRSWELLGALGLAGATDKLVADYSVGMTKKIPLANALIHAPRSLILGEPLEAVDPVFGQTIRDLLRDYVDNDGTVLLSSHIVELAESIYDGVGIMTAGRILVLETTDQVRGDVSLQQKLVELVDQGRMAEEETLQWLRHPSP